ncbi:MAG: DEAD/DEAH box helicase family protein, partial [archaeon]
SWEFSTWNNPNTEMVNYVKTYKDEFGSTVVETKDGYGFAPTLVKHLRGLGYILLKPNGAKFSLAENCKAVKIPAFRFKLRDYQMDCYLKWSRDKLGVIKSPTGSGKTVIGAYAIKETKYKTLVLVHTLDLVELWYNSLSKSFGFGFKTRVGIFGGNKKIEDCIHKDIIIGTYQSALKEKNMEYLKDAGFGFALLDECIPVDSIISTNFGDMTLKQLMDFQSNSNRLLKVNYFDNKTGIINEATCSPFETRVKDVYTIELENGTTINSSLDHKFLTKLDDSSIDYKSVDSCKNIAFSLQENYNMERNEILSRLYGYILGDGHLDKNFNVQVYGIKEDLQVIEKEIQLLGFKSYGIKERNVKGHIKQTNGNVLEPEGNVATLNINSSFGKYLHSLGYPIGNKTDCVYNMPKWIKNGSLSLQKEFLAGFLGAEGSVITQRKNKNFLSARTSMYKREDIVKQNKSFINDFNNIFGNLGVKVNNVKYLDGNTRKDGSKTINIEIRFANDYTSLYNYCKIGFRYCKHKEIKNGVIRSYYDYIENQKQLRNKTYCKTLELYEEYGSRKKVYDILTGKKVLADDQITFDDFFENTSDDETQDDIKKYEFETNYPVTEGVISDWIHPHKDENGNNRNVNTQTPKNILNYEDWLNKVYGDVIFMSINSIKYRSTEQCYNMTVHDENHNYVLNGCISRNCHHVPAQTFKKVVNSVNIPYKMGLSATPKRLDGREGDIYALLDNIKANVSLSQLIKRGHVVKPYFYNIPVIDREVTDEVSNSDKSGLAKAQLLKQLSSQSKVKIKKMMRLVNDLIDRDETFLIFADFIESAQIIEEVINEYLCKPKKNCFKSVPRVDQKMNSETRNDLFNNVGYKYSGLIFAKLGSEGIDIPKIDNIIILSPSKSPTTFSQRVGRSLRTDKGKKYSKVFQFVLKNTNEEDWSEYSFQEYKNEGFVPKKIDIPEIDME